MTTFPNSPRLLKCGIVLIDSVTGDVLHTIALQYNPATLSRTLQVKGVGGEGAQIKVGEGEVESRSEALRLTGPAVETIKLEAEIDAADQMEEGDSTTAQFGILPQLALLETIIYPKSGQLMENNIIAKIGTIEIAPNEVPLSLFVWSKNRILPVRITAFSVTEEAFDPALNPIRAKLSLGMRVLSVDDLGFNHKGGSLFMTYLQAKEQLAIKQPRRTRSALGIEEIP